MTEELKFRQDNPGGDWLKKHQTNVEHKMKNAEPNTLSKSGLNGKVTGYFNKNLHLPTHYLKNVPGAMGEHHYRDDFSSSKHQSLDKNVKSSGKFDTEKHAILIGINHKGKPHVLEGNHRLAHAIKHGHEKIHASVQYYNGGESVLGQGFHPDQLTHLHNHGKPKSIMKESFGTFFKNKRKRSEPIPKGKSLEDIHDEYTDATMHYLNQVHKLTHPDSPWHKVINKLGGNSRYVKDLHDDVKNLIDKHGDKT